MTARLRVTVAVTTAALGVALLLAWAAATGPVGLVGDRTPHDAAPTSTRPDDPARDQPDEAHAHDRVDDRDAITRPTTWAYDTVSLATVVAALYLLGVAVRGLATWVAPRLPRAELVLDLDPLPDLERARATLAAEHRAQRTALEGGDVRNAVVACWVLLEEAAERTDLARRPSETATEFVVRLLHALDVDPRPVAELAALFHEARFSTHPLGEDARTRAVRALEAVHADLPGVPLPHGAGA